MAALQGTRRLTGRVLAARKRVSPAKKLTPGSYTLVVTAIGAKGQTSAPQTIRFAIVRH
ncbi:MAG TPA: hypothetical protein VFH80_01985 [Solirubrobacteraceae bacterium]|nr:hypothetical protein [Solirubrobacteraceae bacterium]